MGAVSAFSGETDTRASALSEDDSATDGCLNKEKRPPNSDQHLMV